MERLESQERRLTHDHALREIYLDQYEGEQVYYVPLDSIILRVLFRNLEMLHTDETCFEPVQYPRIKGPAFIVATEVVRAMLKLLKENDSLCPEPRIVHGPANWEAFAMTFETEKPLSLLISADKIDHPKIKETAVSMRVSNIQQLPSEILQYILAFLPSWRRINLLVVCKRLQQQVIQLAHTGKFIDTCNKIMAPVNSVVGTRSVTNKLIQAFIQIEESGGIPLHQKQAILSKFVSDITELLRTLDSKHFKIIQVNANEQNIPIPKNCMAELFATGIVGVARTMLPHAVMNTKNGTYLLFGAADYRRYILSVVRLFAQSYWELLSNPDEKITDNFHPLYKLLEKLASESAGIRDIPTFLQLLVKKRFQKAKEPALPLPHHWERKSFLQRMFACFRPWSLSSIEQDYPTAGAYIRPIPAVIPQYNHYQHRNYLPVASVEDEEEDGLLNG